MGNELEVAFVSKPLPVFKSILDKHEELNYYLKKVILEHRKYNPKSNSSNVKAWHSSWQTHLENKNFQSIQDIVVNACDFISSEYFKCPGLYWEVKNLWAMMYEDGESTQRHSHLPFDYSSCYYVDVEPDSAPIIFEKNLLTIQPENGMLLIWPSILEHEVPPTKGKRMGISMNIVNKFKTEIV